jgi:hypothetical protein
MLSPMISVATINQHDKGRWIPENQPDNGSGLCAVINQGVTTAFPTITFLVNRWADVSFSKGSGASCRAAPRHRLCQD